MRNEIITPPRTVMEVFRMLPEGTLAEVIENTLYMSPTPSTNHQRLITLLLTQIHKYVSDNSLGEVFPAPLDVFLDEHSNAVHPDILFISKKNISILDDNSMVRGSGFYHRNSLSRKQKT
jgi:Uma2 family endonuclease